MTSLTMLCLYNLALQGDDALKKTMPLELKKLIEKTAILAASCMFSPDDKFNYMLEDPELAFFLYKRQYLDEHYINQFGQTALHFAATSGNLKLFEYLINKNLNPTVIDKFGHTVLHDAASSGNPEIVRKLIETYNLDKAAVDCMGCTVLHDAAMSGNLEVVRYLIETHHLDPTAVDYYRDTVLHKAAMSGNLELVRYLIETHHLDPTAVDKKCKYTNNSTCKVLHDAARSGNLELVRYLIETHHLDPTAIDDYGLTILDKAFQGTAFVCEEEEINDALFDYLIKLIGNKRVIPDRKYTFLNLIVKRGEPTQIEYLKRKGYLNATDV